MYKVIIVDDEYIIRTGLCSYLERESVGFEVVGTFSDGRDAINFIHGASQKVNVVLTDIKMSDVSGLELAEMIHSEYPDIYVVLISGYKEFDYAKKAFEFGVFDYILKPIDFNELDTVFMKLKDQLDKNVKLETMRDAIEKNQLVMSKFLSEADAGIFYDSSQMENRAAVLGIDAEVILNCCARIRLKRQIKKISDDHYWHYDVNGVDNAIQNILLDEKIENFVVNSNKTYMNLIVIPKIPNSFQNAMDFERHLKTLWMNGKEELNSMGICVDETGFECYENLFSMNSSNTFSDMEEFFSKIRNVFMMNLVDKDTLTSMEYILNFVSKYNSAELMDNFKHLLKDIMDAPKDTMKPLEELLKENRSEEISNKVIRKAVKYIHENYKSDISLADVSGYCYMSPSYFSRLFKIHTGDSFLDYLINIRIKKAIELLETTNMKVVDVAKSVGYDNLNYFIRIFKKRMGLTPGEYKKREV